MSEKLADQATIQRYPVFAEAAGRMDISETSDDHQRRYRDCVDSDYTLFVQ